MAACSLDICIPCFNEAFYLHRCLNSIHTHMGPYCQNTRIWVIDDDSMYSNDYEAVIAQYPQLNISYYKNTQNKGPGACRNLVLQQGQAKWITFIDDDDVFCANPFYEMNASYDMIVSVLLAEPGMRARPQEVFFSSITGILFSRDYLQIHSFRFFEELGICGGEDSIFLLITTLSTMRIKHIDQFVKWYARPNSSYALTVSSVAYLNNYYLFLHNLLMAHQFLPGLCKKNLLFALLEEQYQEFKYYTNAFSAELGDNVITYMKYLYILLLFRVLTLSFTLDEISLYCQTSCLMPIIYAAFTMCEFIDEHIIYTYVPNSLLEDYDGLPSVFLTPCVPILFNYKTFYQYFTDTYIKPNTQKKRQELGLPAKYWQS